jgi:hypothetical protein
MVTAKEHNNVSINYPHIKGTNKVVNLHAQKAHTDRRGTAPFTINQGTRWKWHCHFTSREIANSPQHSLKTVLGVPHSHYGHVFAEGNKLLPLPGIEPQIVQPIA